MDDPARGPRPAPAEPPYAPAQAVDAFAQPGYAPAAPPVAPVTPRKGRRISLPGIVIGLTILGSSLFIGYVVLQIEDNQIPLMATGFVVLGASLLAVAAWTVIGMWRAASRARGGRAFALAIVGGLAGLGAIGCFTVAALAALVWNT
jgi:MFS family permease